MKRVAIITGANGGMGAVHTRTVAQAGYEVVMACQDLNKARPTYEQIQREVGSEIVLLPLDLSSLASIRAFVTEIQQRYTHVDLLLNNAGVLCHGPATTVDGIEYTTGVNYLGHYFLTHQLVTLMSAGSRIVNMVSLTYRFGEISDTLFAPLTQKQFNRFSVYSNSKLALLYFTLDAAEAWASRGIVVNCADPGIVSTNIICQGNVVIDKLCDIFFRPIIRTPEQGAATMLYLALDPQCTQSGGCYKSKKPVKLSKSLIENPRRQWLREETEKIIAQITKNI